MSISEGAASLHAGRGGNEVAAPALHGDGLGRRPRTAMVTLGLLSAFGPLSLDLYLPSLPHIASSLASSDATVQLTLSGSLAGLAVGQLIVGPLSDSLGRRRPLLVGLIGFILMSIVCALAPTIGVLIAARIAQGLSGAAGLVIARAVVRDAFPDARIAHVFSALMLINGLAPVLAPLIGGALLHVVSWRGLFWVLAGVGAAIASVAVAALPETLPPHRRHSGGLRTTARAAHDVSRDRLFMACSAILAFASGTLFVYISLSSFVLQTRYGLTASQFSAVFALNSIGIILGGRINSYALRRFTSPGLLGSGLAVMTIAAIVAMIASAAGWGLPGLLPPLFVAVGSIGVVVPNTSALALTGHARNAGTASAILGASQFLAGAVAGPLASVHGASPNAMTIGMSAAVCTAFILWIVGVRNHKVIATPVSATPAAPAPIAGAPVVEELAMRDGERSAVK